MVYQKFDLSDQLLSPILAIQYYTGADLGVTLLAENFKTICHEVFAVKSSYKLCVVKTHLNAP